MARPALVCLLALCGAAAAQAAVEARLDRTSVAAGNGAILTLEISGSSAGNPELPEVKDLIIRARGQSQQMRIVNGRTSTSVTYNYVVGSNIPGDYHIPAIRVEVDGKTEESAPLDLKVLVAGAAKPPQGASASQAPPGQPAAADAGDDTRFGFLTVEPLLGNRQYVYVGEIAPVRIRAWIPEDARAQLRGTVQPEGRAYTLHNVSSEPEQTRETRDGKRYLAVTWYGGISAAKAGKYPVSLSLNATIAVRDDTAPRPRRPRGPFDDPFFDSFFDDLAAPMVQKDVTLKSTGQPLEVRPLPEEGRPGNFTGAVGEFKLSETDIPSACTTGEPIQIAARVTGSGNFALLSAPMPVPADGWKTYPAKDEFTPGDVASFSGTKDFHYSAVLRKAGNRTVALGLSYFDPAKGTYVEIKSPETALRVSGPDIKDNDIAATPSSPAPAAANDGTEPVGPHTAPSPATSLVPLYRRPEFTWLLGASVAMAALGGVAGALRRRREDPRLRSAAALDKAIREAVADATKCASANNASGFFEAGRLALQHQLGSLWNQSPRAITLAEVNARLAADSPVARFFQEADQRAYGRAPEGDSSAHWRQLLDQALASLRN